MSNKYVLIPLKLFTELCSSTKRNGEIITGVVKTLGENETKKRSKAEKPRLILLLIFSYPNNYLRTQTKKKVKQEKPAEPKNSESDDSDGLESESE